MTALTMEQIIKNQNDYCGVSAWHAAGFKGQGVTVWNCEKTHDSHGKGTAKRVLDAAPACNLVVGTVSMSLSQGKVQRCEVVDNEGNKHDVHDWITLHKVKIITASLKNLFKEVGTPTGDFWQDISRRYGIIIINSAGNDGSQDFDFSKRVAWHIGALGLADGKPKRTNYSSTGEGLDFMDFTARNGGTSCAAPYFAGKCALVLQRFPEFSPTTVYEFMRANSEDLEDAGEDNETGWGLPVLPPIKEEQEGDEMADKKTNFKDVPAGAWYEDAVAYCVEKGYMQGFSSEEFKPDQGLTRAQFCQALYNYDKARGVV